MFREGAPGHLGDEHDRIGRDGRSRTHHEERDARNEQSGEA
jgi:hypothetical protein